MKKSGQITVFLSLALMCTCSLMFALLESARTAGARWYLQMAVNSSLESVLAGYHRGLWDDYRLLLLEAPSEEEISQIFCDYLDTYVKAPNWYPMGETQAEVEETRRITDEGGRYLEEEVLDYMKYGIFTQLEVAPEEAEMLLAQMKEARAVTQISSSYNSHTKKALKLERALQAVDNSLRAQNRYYGEGMERLRECDGKGFLSRSDSLIKELKRMPGLVKTYRKQADQLSEDVESSRLLISGQSKDLSETARTSLEEELRSYETYIRADGERRQEIEHLPDMAERNIGLVKAVQEEAKAAIQYINDWEPSDDDDELDEEEVWAPVISHFSRMERIDLSCPAGIQDEKKRQWLERITEISGYGLLSIIMPEGREVSSGAWNCAEWPSSLYGTKDNTDGGNLLKRAIVDQYCDMVFTDALSGTQKPVFYEMEYLLAGQASDRENLSWTANEMLAVRTGLNLVHILTDSAKREAARALAAVIVGSVGLAPLTSVMAVFIMGVWALAEGIMDLRTLLEGGKVPVIKNADDWQLDLAGMLRLGETGLAEKGASRESGFSYQGYLKLLLLLVNPGVKYYRMMDMIQANLVVDQPDFKMRSCVFLVDIKGKACGKHLFFSMNLVDNLAGVKGRYQMEAGARKSY